MLLAKLTPTTPPLLTGRWKLCMLTVALTVMLIVQYSVLWQVVTYYPAGDPRYAEYLRLDCVASTKGGKLAGNDRDCWQGQGTLCTRDQPCTPCDARSTRLAQAHSCQACSSSNTGNCYFTEELGPWCNFTLTGGTIEPCRICCRDLGL